jgi:hypothetical protein
MRHMRTIVTLLLLAVAGILSAASAGPQITIQLNAGHRPKHHVYHHPRHVVVEHRRRVVYHRHRPVVRHHSDGVRVRVKVR